MSSRGTGGKALGKGRTIAYCSPPSPFTSSDESEGTPSSTPAASPARESDNHFETMCQRVEHFIYEHGHMPGAENLAFVGYTNPEMDGEVRFHLEMWARLSRVGIRRSTRGPSLRYAQVGDIIVNGVRNAPRAVVKFGVVVRREGETLEEQCLHVRWVTRNAPAFGFHGSYVPCIGHLQAGEADRLHPVDHDMLYVLWNGAPISVDSEAEDLYLSGEMDRVVDEQLRLERARANYRARQNAII